jgi:L-alanine-DL-glutamate epimerase-like enolase superfamily enzyme
VRLRRRSIADIAYDERMRVERVDVDLVRLPLEHAVASAGARVAALDYVLVRLATEDGVAGLGYACLYAAAPGGGAHGGALRALTADLAPLVEGADVALRGQVWQALWRASAALGHGDLALAAVSAYDLALWDLAGRAADLPVWQLLGAARDRLPVYYSGLFLGASVDELMAEASSLAGLGYRAVKMRVGRPSPEEDLARVAAVQEVLGPGVRLLVDCSRSLDVTRAITLGRRLEARGVGWLEEPLAPEDLAGAARVAAALDLPLAAGESCRTPAAVRALLDHRAADVVMLDIQRLGGLTGWRQAAALGAAHGVALSNHLFLEVTAPALAACPWASAPPGTGTADGVPAEHLPWPTPFETSARVAGGELRLGLEAGLGLMPREDLIALHRVG